MRTLLFLTIISSPLVYCSAKIDQRLFSEDESVYSQAVEKFNDSSPKSQAKVVQELANGLIDPDQNRHESSAYALMRIGPGAKSAVPNLARALSDNDGQVRIYAAAALMRIGPESVNAATELIKVLGVPEMFREVYYYKTSGIAAKTLSTIEIPKTSITDLAQALERVPDNGEDSTYVEEALVKFGADAVPAVIKVLPNIKESNKRNRAVRILGRIGPTAKEAIPTLVKALRTEALELSALPGLSQGGSDAYLPKVAIQALKGIGPEAVQTLIKALYTADMVDDKNESSPVLRGAVLAALRAINSEDAAAAIEKAETKYKAVVAKAIAILEAKYSNEAIVKAIVAPANQYTSAGFENLQADRRDVFSKTDPIFQRYYLEWSYYEELGACYALLEFKKIDDRRYGRDTQPFGIWNVDCVSGAISSPGTSTPDIKDAYFMSALINEGRLPR